MVIAKMLSSVRNPFRVVRLVRHLHVTCRRYRTSPTSDKSLLSLMYFQDMESSSSETQIAFAAFICITYMFDIGWNSDRQATARMKDIINVIGTTIVADRKTGGETHRFRKTIWETKTRHDLRKINTRKQCTRMEYEIVRMMWTTWYGRNDRTCGVH